MAKVIATPAKAIELRVTRRSHTFEGKQYGPGLPAGDTFMGTEKMLKALGDRLEPASLAKSRARDEGAEKAAADALAAETTRAEAAEAKATALEAELAALKAAHPVTAPRKDVKDADTAGSK